MESRRRRKLWDKDPTHTFRFFSLSLLSPLLPLALHYRAPRLLAPRSPFRLIPAYRRCFRPFSLSSRNALHLPVLTSCFLVLLSVQSSFTLHASLPLSSSRALLTHLHLGARAGVQPGTDRWRARGAASKTQAQLLCRTSSAALPSISFAASTCADRKSVV